MKKNSKNRHCSKIARTTLALLWLHGTAQASFIACLSWCHLGLEADDLADGMAVGAPQASRAQPASSSASCSGTPKPAHKHTHGNQPPLMQWQSTLRRGQGHLPYAMPAQGRVKASGKAKPMTATDMTGVYARSLLFGRFEHCCRFWETVLPDNTGKLECGEHSKLSNIRWRRQRRTTDFRPCHLVMVKGSEHGPLPKIHVLLYCNARKRTFVRGKMC